MIKIKEMLINSVRPLKNRSLAITIWIKQEDISKDDVDKLQDYWTSETPIVWILQEFEWEVIEDKTPKLRQRLAILLKDYCEKNFIKEEDELKKLYSKYWIETRKDLTETQLNEIIEMYQLWLFYNN